MTAGGRPPSWLVLAAFGAIYVVWGSTYLAIRFAIETLPPFLMAGARFLVAGGLLYAWAAWRGAGERPTWREWRAATVAGAFMLLGGVGAVVWSEQWVPSGLVALVVAVIPLWMVLFEALRPGGGRPTRQVWVGLALGFAGVAVLVGRGGVAASGVPVGPALALLAGTASWAIGSLYSRSAPLPASPALATAMEMLGGGALLTVVALLRGEAADLDPGAVSALSAAALGYLVVFGSLIAFSAYAWLLRVSTPDKVATYAYVNPLIAVLLGWLVAGEPLDARVGLATLLVVPAVVLVTSARSSALGAGPRRDRNRDRDRDRNRSRIPTPRAPLPRSSPVPRSDPASPPSAPVRCCASGSRCDR